MRVLLCGGRSIAASCLDCVRDAGDTIIGVVANPEDDGQDKWWTVSLRRYASDLGIPVWQPASINDSEFAAFLRDLKIDIILSILYAHILKPETLALARNGCFNLHYSLLPRHRGCLTLVNAILSGDKETGATLHRMDCGVDTGNILFQNTVSIEPHDTAYTLRMKCSGAAAALFEDKWAAVRSGLFVERPQELSRGCYNRKVWPNDGCISMQWPEHKLDRFIRALTFPGYYVPAKFVFGGAQRSVWQYSPGHYAVDGRILEKEQFFRRYVREP